MQESTHIASLTFTKEKRIRKRRDFLRVQRRGSRVFGRYVVIVAQADNFGKIGITVPKKVGAAHERNKIKRRVRHIFRHQQDLFTKRSLVIIAKPAANLVSFAELSGDIVSACARIKLDSKPRAYRQR